TLDLIRLDVCCFAIDMSFVKQISPARLLPCVHLHTSGRAGAPARAPVVPAHGLGSCRRHLRQPGPLAGRLPAFVDASKTASWERRPLVGPRRTPTSRAASSSRP